MKISERMKRLWRNPDPPDHPLTEGERDQIHVNRYDELADAAAKVLSHGDPNVTGKRD